MSLGFCSSCTPCIRFCCPNFESDINFRSLRQLGGKRRGHCTRIETSYFYVCNIRQYKKYEKQYLLSCCAALVCATWCISLGFGYKNRNRPGGGLLKARKQCGTLNEKNMKSIPGLFTGIYKSAAISIFQQQQLFACMRFTCVLGVK